GGRPCSPRDGGVVATGGGAGGVGRSEHIGAIAVGARADLVAVRRPSDPGPDPIDDLVRGATREDVTDVWSAGSRVVAGGRHRAADEVHAARERVHHDLARTADERARVRRTIAELEPEVERIRLARSSPPRPQDRG
ncbi:MAG: amidohydrolase family protein, partial [Nitriliruptoraceae bacterium]|nr:amidohydrolase family protein [Nitriliruptoraceae bacterium]